MRYARLGLLAGAFVAGLSGCGEPATSPEQKQVASGPAVADPEMARKMAEAKAAYEKLSPQEKAKLQEDAERVANTMPLPLAEAGRIPVTAQGRPETTLAALAAPGRPTVIAAWASWCVPCKVEARDLARLRQKHGPDALNIVYLNVGDPKVEASKGPVFLRETGAEALGLTMLDRDDFLKLTRVDQLSIPRVLIYDANGQPTKVISGAITGKADTRIEDALRPLLSGA